MDIKAKPNIIFIVLDSARRDLFGAYGNSKKLTPFIDSLAKNSLVMMDHYAAGCGSAQAHVSLFLGQHSTRHGVVHNMSEMTESLVSLPNILSKKGYKTYGHCMASFIPPAGYEDQFGFDEFFYPGKSGVKTTVSFKNKLIGFLKKFPKIWLFSKSIYSSFQGIESYTRAAAKSLDGKASLNYLLKKIRQNKGVPVFAYTTLLHPHTPYAPPQWCIDKVFEGKPIDIMAYKIQKDMHAWVNGDLGNIDSSLSDMKKLYEAEMIYADHLLKEFVESLKSENLFDNTILIVTSDHGELFGEHGQLNHGATVWEEIYRLPLFIHSPKFFPEEKKYNGLSSGLDIMPTILDLIDYYDYAKNETIMDGISLLNKPDHERFLVVDSPPMVLPERLKKYPNVITKGSIFFRAIRTNKYKYLWQSNGQHFLFDDMNKEDPKHSILESNSILASELHEIMLNYYNSIDSKFDISIYPVNMGATAAKKMTNPLIQKELKKLGYM